MLVHVLKMVWNRKRGNALLMVEIFFTFLVVFAVALGASYLADNLRQPLGFDGARVWRVAIEVEQRSDDTWRPAHAAQLERMLAAAESLPWVEGAAGAYTVPYTFNESVTVYDWQGKTVESEVIEVTDGFARVMGLRLIEGRWFGAEDDAAVRPPAVITAAMARALYPGESPLGKPSRIEEGGEPRDRIVGVVETFRRTGGLAPPGNLRFDRVRLGDPESRPPRNLVLRVAPGVGAEREEELVDRLAAVAPEWSVEVRTLAELRDGFYRLTLAPLIAGGLVAGFLLLMVGLGLAGVVWQNVTRRTREIGLRRAAGASRAAVRRQLLGELLVTAGLGVAAAVLLVVQLPVVGLLGSVPWRVVGASVVVAAAILALVTAAAGLYPSWLASRLQPAEALRYE